MAEQPELLDLYCCQGGAGKGYHDAGFLVTGVDQDPQPRYPFTFVQADALEYLARITASGEVKRYALIHASPPCQLDSDCQRIQNRDHPDLIGPTREALEKTGVPYVIENVAGALPKLKSPVELCGTMFRLQTYRHRYFEPGGWFLPQPDHPEHTARQAKMGRLPAEGEFIQAIGNFPGVDMVRDDWNVPWMNRDGVRESIPPAYAEWVGRAFLNREDDMSETEEKPRGACTGCKFDYQLGQGKAEYKGMLVVRKHLSRTGPGECDGSRKPPAGADTTEEISDDGMNDTWQTPGKVAEPAPEAEQRDGVPPVFYASYDTDMAECGHPISEGDLIQSDGEGGWRCTDCIVEPEHNESVLENYATAPQQLPHDRGHETITHIPDGHDFTDSSGAVWRHGGPFDACTTQNCIEFRNRINPPDTTRQPEHACHHGVFMELRNCPEHGYTTEVVPVTPGGVPVVPMAAAGEEPVTLLSDDQRRSLGITPVAVAPGGVPVLAPDVWSKPAPASAAELPPVHGQPDPKRDRWGRYVFNGQSHTRATTFAKAASSTHSLSEWRERMVVLGLVQRKDLLAMAHGLHVKRDRKQLNAIASDAKDAAGIKVAANLGTAYHAFSERLDAGLMRLEDVPEEYRPRLAEYQRAVAAHGLVTRPEWIERSTAVRADQVAADVPVGGTLDRIFQLPSGELVIGDLKTGSDLSYGWGEIAVQLALYAHGVNTMGLFDWNTDTWQSVDGHHDDASPRVRTDYGIVIHLPADGSGCTLYRIDLTAGWRRAQVCGQVMAMQKSKDTLATEMFPDPVTARWANQRVTEPATAVVTQTVSVPATAAGVYPEPPRSAHLAKGLEIVGYTTVLDGLGQTLAHARESGKFTEAELTELKAACAARWTELQGA